MSTIDVPTAGDPVHASWGSDVASAVNDIYDYSRVPYAYPIGLHLTVGQNTHISLNAVSGGTAGAIIVPFFVPGPMEVGSYCWWSDHSSYTRSVEFSLYRDVGSTTLQRVTGSDATASYTATSAGMRNSNDTSGGPVIAPGIYWLAIRNTDSSRVHDVGVSNTGGMGSFTTFRASTSGVAALSDTLDVSGWSSYDNPVMVRINGRVFGESGEFT